MDEVIPGLWIGDLASALDVANLKQHNIQSVLSAMRGRVSVNETFIRHQVLLDDTEDADILIHLLPSITFIDSQIDKGRGVLVHCQAGMSRSAAIVAAYLMYSQQMDLQSAMNAIRNVRPNVSPNENFLAQLEIFHKASFKISRRDKHTRMYYLERAVEEVMNGDGSPPPSEFFAKYPHTPSDSGPVTPGGPRRRIRCKMCRQELATREHMLDHGQLGPPTPRSLPPSRRLSTEAHAERPPSLGQAHQPRSRLSSSSIPGTVRSSALVMGMTAITPDGGVSALETGGSTDDETRQQQVVDKQDGGDGTNDDHHSTIPTTDSRPRLPPSHISFEPTSLGPQFPNPAFPASDNPSTKRTKTPPAVLSSTIPTPLPTQPLISPSDLSAHLLSNPKLAELRGGGGGAGGGAGMGTGMSPPILANPRCSGYFVEPMKWMEPFLSAGHLSGKITCPNKKCGAKLGNYDWAGVCCGCKEWVTPGFCINRGKVDEVL